MFVFAKSKSLNILYRVIRTRTKSAVKKFDVKNTIKIFVIIQKLTEQNTISLIVY